MRIHLPSLPHTETTRDYDWCAYTAKVRRFADMMTAAGHDMILYAGTRNDAAVTEHVAIFDDDDRDRFFGHYDWATDVFDGFNVDAPWWDLWNRRCASAIAERSTIGDPNDVLGIIAGRCQEPLTKRLPDMRAVEWGIGYEGVFADFRVFESYAWAHRLAAHRELGAVRFFDTVIPNAFDPGDLMRSHEPGDYLLYLGRMTAMKGLAIVGDIAARVDYPVITAGQGPERVPGAEHVGVVTGMDKARLLADARAVLVPTMYLEPFGGVAVEAMLCGTPAVTTDWGAFTETVSPGVSGFRCSTLAEFVDAVHRAGDMDRVAVADYAACRYTTDVVGPMYDRYLARLATLGDAGWYTMPPAG